MPGKDVRARSIKACECNLRGKERHLDLCTTYQPYIPKHAQFPQLSTVAMGADAIFHKAYCSGCRVRPHLAVIAGGAVGDSGWCRRVLGAQNCVLGLVHMKSSLLEDQ